MLLLAVLTASGLDALAQNAADTTYLPLDPENSWEYVLPIPGDFPSRHAVLDSASIGDTLYYVIKLPFVESDTLRVAADGTVRARRHGREEMLLDVNAENGATYLFPFDANYPDLDYEVTVARGVSVDVLAGSFDRCIRFSFDAPGWVDEEWSVTLAPGVGIANAYGNGGHYRELWLARIDGAVIPPLDATIPDTLDWRGYFPMEVGNAWEYRHESFFEPGYERWEIVGDSVTQDHTGFAVVTSRYDGDRRETFSTRRFWYYDESSRSFFAGMIAGTRCDFGAPFPVPQHQLSPVVCPGPTEMWLSGGYVDGELVLGSDTLAYPAWKDYEYPITTNVPHFHGVGAIEWYSEGSTDSAHLIHARLGGVSYGESIISTSVDDPAAVPLPRPAAEVYPNPFGNRFTIELENHTPRSSQGPIRFEIFDVLGRQVQAGEVASQRNAISTAALAPGVYVLRLRVGSRVLESYPIVKSGAP